MQSNRLLRTGRHALILVIPLLFACDTFLPLRIAICESTTAPSTEEPSYEQDPDNPCLQRLTSDPAELPTYAQALAKAECDALNSAELCRNFSADVWQIGFCNSGQHRYISFNGGFGGPTMLFDATTQQLVSILETTDAVDVPCGITTYKIASIECNDRVVTRSLCPFDPFAIFLP